MNARRSLRILTLGFVCLSLTVSSGCANQALHSTWGHRHAMVMAAQTNAHPARDVIVRGEEAQRLLRKYYFIIQGGQMMMGMGGMGMGGMGSMGGMSSMGGMGSMGGMSSMGSMMGNQSAGSYGTGSTSNLSTAGVPPLR